MSKLYPPTLGEKIPAFYDSTIYLPIIMNKAVSYNDIGGFSVLIKTVATGTEIVNIQVNKTFFNTTNLILEVNNLPISKFQVGTYYKVQVAYIDANNNGEIGYYSSIGVIKYTAKPTLIINGLDLNGINSPLLQYTGVYENLKDPSEKLYSYEFKLFSNGDLIETSGIKIHNNFIGQDNVNEACDSYIFSTDLNTENKNYEVIYEITTINNLTITSPAYKISSVIVGGSGELDGKMEIFAELDDENGLIKVGLRNKEGQGVPVLSGKFILCRKNISTDSAWYPLFKFNTVRKFNNSIIYYDYLIEHGNNYIYSLQQFTDDGVLIDKISMSEDAPIVANFEHMYLYDGEKQLKLIYNAKVNSIKTDLSFTKIDTLGNKFPIFFTGGNMGYKEFPLSGLISYHSDDNELFIPKGKINILTNDEITTKVKNNEPMPENNGDVNLTHSNFYSERLFKLLVLQFLEDGKPKVLKTPAEGSYIVMLMNSSLSPETKVGRMLHNFSSTAYECASFDYEGLIETGFINNNTDPVIIDANTELEEGKIVDPTAPIDKNQYAKYKTILFGYDLNHELPDRTPINESFPHQKNINEYLRLLESQRAQYINNYQIFTTVAITQQLNVNILPGVCSYVQFENMTPGALISINDEKFVIGNTGFFTLSYPEFLITSVELKNEKCLNGQMVCRYYDNDSYNDLFNQNSYYENKHFICLEQYLDLGFLQKEFNKIDEESNDLLSIIVKRNNLIQNIYVQSTRNQINTTVGVISNNAILPTLIRPPMATSSSIPWSKITLGPIQEFKYDINKVNYLKVKSKDIRCLYCKKNLGKFNPSYDLSTTTFYLSSDYNEKSKRTIYSLEPGYTYQILHMANRKVNGENLIYGYISPDILHSNYFLTETYSPILELQTKGNEVQLFNVKNQMITLSDQELLNNLQLIRDKNINNQLDIYISYTLTERVVRADFYTDFDKVRDRIKPLIANYNKLNNYYTDESYQQISLIDYLKQVYLYLIITSSGEVSP